MNYLGHLYLSGNDTRLMCANLYGDFVKGSLHELPQWIEQGVQLHREIDHFTDHHAAVRELLPLLREDLPKVAPIAIDIYFDYLLAKNWSEYHPQEYNQFTSLVFRDFNGYKTEFPDHFNQFLGYFIEREWINYYPYFDGLERLSQGVSSKLSFPNQLGHAPTLFLRHEKEIENGFKTFIADARKTFLKEDLRILL